MEADWLKGILDSEGKPDIKKAAEILRNLRSILGETVLLFTFRTFPEGGNLSISPDAYEALNLAVAAQGLLISSMWSCSPDTAWQRPL